MGVKSTSIRRALRVVGAAAALEQQLDRGGRGNPVLRRNQSTTSPGPRPSAAARAIEPAAHEVSPGRRYPSRSTWRISGRENSSAIREISASISRSEPAHVERQGHPSGSTATHFSGRMAIVARARGADPLVGNVQRVLDQEERSATGMKVLG